MPQRLSVPVLRSRLETRAILLARRLGYQLAPLAPEDRAYLDDVGDRRVPLPPGATARLRSDHPRLTELRSAYDRLDLPVTKHSRWAASTVDQQVDLSAFRGDSLFVWSFRESARVTAMKHHVSSEYVRSRDDHGLFERLGEDGAFGCWTFDGPSGRHSRDLVDSVNELLFLQRHLGILDRSSLRVLDIGAGYGRLAHRMAQAMPQLTDYCCVDAVPEGTFLSEYYLEHRGVAPPARVVPLHRFAQDVEPGTFDLAVNVHSFSECRLEAVQWWIDRISELRVPNLLIIPNDGDRLLSTEPDLKRHDFAPLLERAGYKLTVNEPLVDSDTVRGMLDTQDHFLLYERS